MPEIRELKVGLAIQNMLPEGTYPFFDLGEGAIPGQTPELTFREHWGAPPVWPTDLFAVTAHLIYTSGLLTYFEPDPDHSDNTDAYPPCFSISKQERDECLAAGATWATKKSVPGLATTLWKVLVKAHKQTLRASLNTKRGSAAPAWWAAAVKLILIADEACVGLGARASAEHPDRWMIDQFEIFNAAPFSGKTLSGTTAYRAGRQRATFGVFSDPDVGCVQPKSRISSVGCNLRNLTRNAAYIPHVGSVRCHWQQPIAQKVGEEADDLDVLIVPLPFEMKDAWIVQDSNSKPEPTKRPNWGNFEIRQGWLEDEKGLIELILGEFRKALAALKARRTAGALNGVVFPEYALTEPLFNKICSYLKKEEPGLEFAISGSSSNCEGETGNFVLTAMWPVDRTVNAPVDDRFLLTSRRKHHRWKLSPSQIKTYDLDNILPSLKDGSSWWERHTIAQREIHFFHFRKTSVLTSMICEDLARSDPCHDILRAIGPNLLFALLMDGPQTANRWPARYAATLADDPGTSVLTVTSMGLMDRTNKAKIYDKPSYTVAMWRDETGVTRPLGLDEGSKSILLTLKPHAIVDQTIDGRANTQSWSWRYEQCISL
ncbi:hypothetical protein [Rhizobium sp. GCM10022189]|uniref:hypothetical protein n=1 Tax=Rhizobium sp. GCM10022189 TaxID=3252654 RepID=UPI0036232220